MKTNSENIVDFLISTEGESREQIREYLLNEGIDPEEAKKTVLEIINKRRAERMFEEGKKVQEKFEREYYFNTGIEEDRDSDILIGELAYSYRDKNNISKEEEEKIEKADKKALEILKKIKKESKN